MDIINGILKIIMSIQLVDVIDIILLTILMYNIMKLMDKTNTLKVFWGIVMIFIASIVLRSFELKTMNYLLDNFFQVSILALIILFQPELRRMLERLGMGINQLTRFKLSDKLEQANMNAEEKQREHCISCIAEACDSMSKAKTGALIVMEMRDNLDDLVADRGMVINADISTEYLLSLFEKNTPLHDGAVIIRNYRIFAAACYLKQLGREYTRQVSMSLGTRHMAAIGQSTQCDALIIVVSEETGNISVAIDGQLTRDLSKQGLINILRRKLISTRPKTFGNMIASSIRRKNEQNKDGE